jgi:hypothetical protein
MNGTTTEAGQRDICVCSNSHSLPKKKLEQIIAVDPCTLFNVWV